MYQFEKESIGRPSVDTRIATSRYVHCLCLYLQLGVSTVHTSCCYVSTLGYFPLCSTNLDPWVASRIRGRGWGYRGEIARGGITVPCSIICDIFLGVKPLVPFDSARGFVLALLLWSTSSCDRQVQPKARQDAPLKVNPMCQSLLETHHKALRELLGGFDREKREEDLRDHKAHAEALQFRLTVLLDEIKIQDLELKAAGCAQTH